MHFWELSLFQLQILYWISACAFFPHPICDPSWVNFHLWCKILIEVHCFACEYTVDLAIIYWENIFFLQWIALSGFCSFDLYICPFSYHLDYNSHIILKLFSTFVPLSFNKILEINLPFSKNVPLFTFWLDCTESIEQIGQNWQEYWVFQSMNMVCLFVNVGLLLFHWCFTVFST